MLNKSCYLYNFKIALLSLLFFLLGCFFYLLYHQKIVIIWTDKTDNPVLLTPAKRRSFTLYFFKDNIWKNEQKELIDSDDIRLTINYLTTAWLNQIEEERLTDKPVTIQAVLLNELDTLAFISFDRSPFAKHYSVFQKIMWIEGLLRTIKKNLPKITEVSLLAHHQPIIDMHIDFSHGFPTTGFC